MRVDFFLPCKAFSINAYHYSDKRHKTREARAWEELIKGYLREIAYLTDLAEAHKQEGGCFEVEITLLYPKSVFYNSQGQVSAKTFDCSNFEKPIIDMIFGERMGINDRFVTKITSRKRAHPSFGIQIALELQAHPDSSDFVCIEPDTEPHRPQ